MKANFLSAAWNNIVMANYEVPAELLASWVPAKTALDSFEGKTFVSLVGFMFMNTKIRGLGIPYHMNFEEVNLRFYVKHEKNGSWLRGVSFIREIVPKHGITLIANNLYGEKYTTMRMKHAHYETDAGLATEYEWLFQKKWNKIAATSQKKSIPLRPGSLEEFIAEHYWGFTRINAHRTSAYEVEHPRWEIFPVIDYKIECDFGGLYGEKFSFLKDTEPTSVFMAKGSEIKIFSKQSL